MEMPPEIITDILYRLPAKSLGRFKTVSKKWLAQISDPEFIKRHQNSLKRTHLLCGFCNGTIFTLPLNQPEEKRKSVLSLTRSLVFFYHGTCNGLVLASVDYIVDFWLVILNPTTGNFIQLSEHGFEMQNGSFELEIIYGFGYDTLTNDYKVVTISYFHYDFEYSLSKMDVHVYSLRSNSWRWVMDSPYDHFLGKSSRAVFVNGFFHWIAVTRSDHSPVIVAFSFLDETFSEVPSPYLGSDAVDIKSKSECKLVALGDKLGLFLGDELWLMNEYGVGLSWSKVVIHGLNEHAIVKPKIFYEDGKILLASGGLIWVYDVEDESLCKSIDISRDNEGLRVIGTYVESLVLPRFSETNTEMFNSNQVSYQFELCGGDA